MASRKSAGSKMKSKGLKSSRPSAMPPKTPAPLRAQGGPTTLVPKPPLKGEDTGKIAKPPRDASMPDDAGDNPLKKQELIAKVVERSEVAKKHAKPVIEAMLAVLGDALAEGRDLNLQPMGKIKRKRMKETEKARIIVANIRQPKSLGSSGNAPLPGSTPGGALAPPKQSVAEDGEGR
ncbi:HU family DNA-binding protein [Roseovarius arcticus]|uniref:HU family DNA-binding protein n=1 Tax=Roseovarius arcticus TaxID=2547404 RepID=UPI001FE53BEE|nr:HU family DNA-binding protein [Roseovarius arcticus]